MITWLYYQNRENGILMFFFTIEGAGESGKSTIVKQMK